VMVALADGASYAVESSPAQAAEAAGQISATGRGALLEMRRLLGILRDDAVQGPLQPQPRLVELEQLVERVRAAGVPVRLDVDGELHSLPEGVQLAVFRVAQEALTNTLKHAARPTAVSLRLHCDRDRVELEASDTGPPSADRASEGRGVRGMRERALAYGGRLEAGPRLEGGWRVRMHLGADREGR
jgi:signal transduction histidine kinase